MAKASPGSAFPYMRLGDVYGLAGKYEQARQAYERALSIRADFEVVLKLGALYLAMEKPGKAIEVLSRGIQMTPEKQPREKTARLHYFLALGYAQSGQIQRAKSEIQRASRLAPRDPEIEQLAKKIMGL